ncbi:MAG TPA: hypothetical protein P5040_08455 [Smithella sp.]|nr:hypothetical protein [Smithella sp.]
MQSYDLKLPKNYKAASNKFYIALGGGLIALLVTFNVVFLTLFIGETKTSENALRVLQETSRSLLLIQDSLGKADIQKASVHLADARHQIDAVLSTTPCKECKQIQNTTGETAGCWSETGARTVAGGSIFDTGR